MSSDRSQAAETALSQNRSLAEGYYNIVKPMMEQRGKIAASMLDQGGEPAYLSKAWEGQRQGLTESTALADRGAGQAQVAQAKQATMGGNVMAGFGTTPGGQAIAEQVAGSYGMQGIAQDQQQQQLISFLMGGAQMSGNAAVGMGQQSLTSMNTMRNYNPWAAGIAGGASAAYGVYGGLAQSGVLGRGPQTNYWNSQVGKP